MPLPASTSSRFVLSDCVQGCRRDDRTCHLRLCPYGGVEPSERRTMERRFELRSQRIGPVYRRRLTSGEVSHDRRVGRTCHSRRSALTFDCNAKSASGYGPGDVQFASERQPRYARAGTVGPAIVSRQSSSVYRQTESGTPLAVPLSAAALPLASFPGGASYFNDSVGRIFSPTRVLADNARSRRCLSQHPDCRFA